MSRSFFEKYVEGIKSNFPDTAEIMETLYGLTESGEFKKFDERFNEDDTDLKMKQAKEFFVSMKYSELLEMIKNNASEPEKKDFFSTLPESVYHRIRIQIFTMCCGYRDGGKTKRRFEERYGKPVEEVRKDLLDGWEKYKPYSHEGEKRGAFKADLKEGISLEVINVHTIKPLDEELVIAAAKETGKVVTVEEHSIIGGLGGAVCEVLSGKYATPVLRLGVMDVFGESGPAKELIEKYGLDAKSIYHAVRNFVYERG